jgi:hypothetical protein
MARMEAMFEEINGILEHEIQDLRSNANKSARDPQGQTIQTSEQCNSVQAPLHEALTRQAMEVL